MIQWFQSRCLTVSQLWGLFFPVMCLGMLHHLGLSWKQMWFFSYIAFSFVASIQNLYSQSVYFSLNPKTSFFFSCWNWIKIVTRLMKRGWPAVFWVEAGPSKLSTRNWESKFYFCLWYFIIGSHRKKVLHTLYNTEEEWLWNKTWGIAINVFPKKENASRGLSDAQDEHLSHFWWKCPSNLPNHAVMLITLWNGVVKAFQFKCHWHLQNSVLVHLSGMWTMSEP